jgi:putative transposase
MDDAAAIRGYPLKLRLDNGPELVSVALAEWAEQHGGASRLKSFCEF